MLFVEFMVRVVRAVKSTLFLFPTKASKRVGMDSQKISEDLRVSKMGNGTK